MNSSFILHVCGIHNSNLSEENILHQFKQHGKPGTRRQTLLRIARALGGSQSAHPRAAIGQQGLVPRIDKINRK